MSQHSELSMYLLLQAALSQFDCLLTVSPHYAEEICRDEGMACGMQEVLCSRGVRCAVPVCILYSLISMQLLHVGA